MRLYRYNPASWQEWLPGVVGSAGSLALSLLLVGWLKPQGATMWVIAGLVVGAGYLFLKNVGAAMHLILRSRCGGIWTDAEGFVVVNWLGRQERVEWTNVVSLTHDAGRVRVVWQSPRHWRPKMLDVSTREIADAFDLIQEIAERTGQRVASPVAPAGFIPLGDIGTGWTPREERK
ncbi:MAG: hypothetical protein NZT92_15045 [Abditibacteriales bacterium]|nr:hypothetical protein [Abditibacteriales bacterium]